MSAALVSTVAHRSVWQRVWHCRSVAKNLGLWVPSEPLSRLACLPWMCMPTHHLCDLGLGWALGQGRRQTKHRLSLLGHLPGPGPRALIPPEVGPPGLSSTLCHLSALWAGREGARTPGLPVTCSVSLALLHPGLSFLTGPGDNSTSFHCLRTGINGTV